MKSFILNNTEKFIDQFVERRMFSQKFSCELCESEKEGLQIYIYPYEELKKELFVSATIEVDLYANCMDNSETFAVAHQRLYTLIRDLGNKLQKLIYEFEHWTEIVFNDETKMYFKHKIEYNSSWVIVDADHSVNQKRTFINKDIVFICRQL